MCTERFSRPLAQASTLKARSEKGTELKLNQSTLKRETYNFALNLKKAKLALAVKLA